MEVAGLHIVAPHQEVNRARDALGRFVSAARSAGAAADGMAGATGAADAAARGLAAAAHNEAGAVGASTAAVKANTAAHQANAAAMKMASHQRTNLIFQLQDIGVSLIGGMNPLMVLAQQGTQIVGIFGSVAAALRAVAGFAVGAVVAMWPIVAVVAAISAVLAGLTYEFNKTAKTQVSFFDVAIAGWELVAEAIAKFFGPTVLQIGKWLADLWDWMAPFLKMLGNGIIGIMVGAYNTVVKTWEMLPDAFASLFVRAMNGAIDIVQSGINGILGPVNLLLEKAGLEKIPLADLASFKGTPSGADVAIAGIAGKEFSSALQTDWMGAAGAAWSKRAQEVANRPSKDAAEKAQKEAERQAEAYADMMRSSQQFIAGKNLEAQALGMTTEAAARLRYEQEMLNRAANDNINLSPTQRAEIEQLAGVMASVEERTRSLTEAYEFGKSTLGSFFSDFKSELMNGTSLWGAFAAAGATALETIADKALGMAADGIWDMIFGAAKGGLFGGLPTAKSLGQTGMYGWEFLKSAKGNVFSSPGLHAYANQVVNRPTVFPFANGIGLMGEAGPEAIMPLRRGPDGKLGVQAANQNGGVVINVNNSSGANVTARQAGTDVAGRAIIEIAVSEAVQRVEGKMARGNYRSMGVGPSVKRS